MTLEYVLRNYNARLSVGDKWLVKNNNHYEVYQQKYGQRVKMIENTSDEQAALRALVQDEDEAKD